MTVFLPGYMHWRVCRVGIANLDSQRWAISGMREMNVLLLKDDLSFGVRLVSLRHHRLHAGGAMIDR
jgi:hypothetical protein